ncbi:DoxX family protein [Pseudonocardia acaciae]|uniref:DoxX family protein n=1 Tax=Pseudonocardia acaciae TaxID=551276 RepID=UPI000A01ADC6|nr:DoxX family protein [Pseudonocardia acaciae]
MGRPVRSSYQYGLDPEPPTEVLDIPGGSGRAKHPLRWHTGADLGLLVVRLVLGVIFMGHGAQKMFGSFGGPGLGGFDAFLAGNGYQQTSMLATVTAATELVGGAFVLIGLLTPLAAAGLLAIMINAIWLKLGAGLFGTRGGPGYELELALAGMATALTLAGAGRIALDRILPGFRRPLVSGLPCLVLGVGAAVAVRLLLHP